MQWLYYVENFSHAMERRVESNKFVSFIVLSMSRSYLFYQIYDQIQIAPAQLKTFYKCISLIIKTKFVFN